MLKAVNHDNRGDSQHPHGFVYFQYNEHSDAIRVGYAPGTDGVGPYGLFPSNWGQPTPAHYKLAEDYLRAVYPHIWVEAHRQPV